ncbi:MAG: peptidyl-prolyl cis-trans isomerase [Planctomycetota bacterium]
MPDFRFEIDPDITRASTPPARVYAEPSIHAAAREGIFARGRQLVVDVNQVRIPWKVTTVCALFLIGCASRDTKPAGSVASAWAARDAKTASPSTEYRTRPQADAARVSGEPDAPTAPTPLSVGADLYSEGQPIAFVDGRPIGRNRVVDLLLRSHGVGVLEQLIGLELAARAATEKGLGVTEPDVDFEFDLALRRLSDPLSPARTDPVDRTAAEGLLDSVLAERNISREEFLVTLRRNAYLRKIVQSQQVITNDRLRAEFTRRFGERVQVRHIQLGSAAEAGRVQDRLAAGEDFADLASRYSANTPSARKQGLLDPFSADDEEVPAALRQAAFALQPGQVSNVVRVGEWYHLLKLDGMLPSEPRDFDQVRGELERDLRDRVSEAAMRELYEKLFHQANIDVRDPTVRPAFELKHGRR